jgi:uncharacterized protein YndB with AHSA1/START domain
MKITASAERHIDAPVGRIYRYIRDFREHHPRFLPSQFSALCIEQGGVGAGTVHSFKLTVGGRTTSYRVEVGEPEPGRVLTESDPSRRMLTSFTVDPDPNGGSTVRIDTTWQTDGFQGLIERAFAPRMLRRVYEAELNLLDRYSRDETPDSRPGVRTGTGLIAFV